MSALTKQEERYIELALEPTKLNDKGYPAYAIASSWDYIDDKKGCDTINEWLAYKVFGDKSKTTEIERLKEKFKKVKNIWAGQKHRTGFANFDKFNQWVMEAKDHKSWGFVKSDEKLNVLNEKYKKGDFGFKTFKNFYKWYESQPKECCYCGLNEKDLEKLFKTINNESERKSHYILKSVALLQPCKLKNLIPISHIMNQIAPLFVPFAIMPKAI